MSKNYSILNKINDKKEKNLENKQISEYFEKLRGFIDIPFRIRNEINNISNRSVLVYSSINIKLYFKYYFNFNNILNIDKIISDFQINRVNKLIFDNISSNTIIIKNTKKLKNIKQIPKNYNISKINQNINNYKKLQKKLQLKNKEQTQEKKKKQEQGYLNHINQVQENNIQLKLKKNEKLKERIKNLKYDKIKRNNQLFERNNEYSKIKNRKYLYMIKENNYKQKIQSYIDISKNNIKNQNFKNNSFIKSKLRNSIKITRSNHRINQTTTNQISPKTKHQNIRNYAKFIKEKFNPSNLNIKKPTNNISKNRSIIKKINPKSKKEIYYIGNSYIKIPDNLKKLENKNIENIDIKPSYNKGIKNKKYRKNNKSIKIEYEKFFKNKKFNLENLNKNMENMDSKISMINQISKNKNDSKNLYLKSVNSKISVLKNYLS